MKKVCCLKVIFYWIYLLRYVSQVASTVLTGSSGTFTSPNYPNLPDPPETISDSILSTDQRGFVTCQWEIIVPKGKGIQLKFGHFFMNAPKHSDECDKGEVDVCSGIGKEKRSLDKYCPSNKPDTVTLLNNNATVVFRRPASFSGTGFLISYIAITPNEPMDDFVTCTDMVDSFSRVETFSAVCPSGCGRFTSHTVYGVMPYRDENTHLCRAAVHAGVISDQLGGRVYVKRGPGQPLYIQGTANNISAQSGAMSDFQIDFPAAHICRDRIEVDDSQFTASSYVNSTSDDGTHYSWLPENARLSSLKTSWSPQISSKPQWIQVNLGKKMNITGIITTGSQDPYSIVKLFQIKYSDNNIYWHAYKETGYNRPKIFAGNHNFYAEVRNNFVNPTIVARHIRVYPVLSKELCHPRCGIKLGLTGCEMNKKVIEVLPKDPSPPPLGVVSDDEHLVVTTQPSSTLATSTLQLTPSHDFTYTDTETNKAQTVSIPTNASAIVDGNDDNSDDANPNDDGNEAKTDLKERTIVIIAIVTGLGVTCLLLAALVLILVRKRKKDPNEETIVPKINSRDNATYNAELGMNSIYKNNNSASNKRKRSKNSQQNIDFMNQNYRDTLSLPDSGTDDSFLNERGGVTLRYGQQENGSALPVRASYSTNSDGAGVSGLVGNILYDGNAGKFARNDDDHEYQVILDPVNEPLDPSASGAWDGLDHPSRSKTAQWNRRSFGDQKLSSFAPLNKSTSGPTRSGTFPHRVHNRINDEESHPLITSSSSQPHHSSFTAPRSTKTNAFPPKVSSTKCPVDRSSSSSSSSHQSRSSSDPHFPDGSNYFPPEEQDSQSYDPLFPPQHGRKPSYKVPTSNRSVEAPHLSTFSTNPPHLAVNGEPTFTNGSELPHDPSSSRRLNARSESLNQARLRSGYDHLYKSKVPVTHATMPQAIISTSDYNQLNLHSLPA